MNNQIQHREPVTIQVQPTAGTLAETIRNEFGVEVDPQLVAAGNAVGVLDAFYRTGYWAGHEAVMDQVGGR